MIDMGEKPSIEMIKVWLMELYGITILPDMSGPASVNRLNGKKISYTAKALKATDSKFKWLGEKELVDVIVAYNNLMHEKDTTNSAWNYKKYFAFYEFKEETGEIRFALGDYE